MSDLPRVICDQCLKDAEVGPVVGLHCDLVQIACHDRLEVIASLALVRHGKKKLLWEDISSDFFSEYQLEQAEAHRLHEMLGQIETIAMLHEVRRSRGAEPTIVPRERIDAAIDALMLFRKDP